MTAVQEASRKTLKVKLSSIMYKKNNYGKLLSSIELANRVMNDTYLLFRHTVLFFIENKIFDLLTIDVKLFRVLSSYITNTGTTKGGRPQKVDSKLNSYLYLSFQKFKNDTEFMSYDCSNISYIMTPFYDEMYTAIKNNIKYHYDKYVNKYILANHYDEYINRRNAKNKTVYPFKQELKCVYDDVFYNTKNSDPKYHSFIDLNKSNMVPDSWNSENFETDIVKNMNKYIKCMYTMNKYIQTKGIKSYQFIPLRTNCYNNYVTINTGALIDIFCDGNKGEMFKDSGNMVSQKKLWNQHFNIKKCKLNRYSFNFQIETDGYAVSLNFIKNSEISKKEQKKHNFKQKRREINAMKQNLSSVEFEKIIEEKNNEKDETNKVNLEKKKQQIKQMKEEYKLKTPEEKQQILKTINDKKQFQYIENICKTQEGKDSILNDFNEGKLIVCDPGKRSILFMMRCGEKKDRLNEPVSTKSNNYGVTFRRNHKVLNYTNKTRLMYLKTKKYALLIDKWKQNNGKNKGETVNDKYNPNITEQMAFLKNKYDDDIYKMCNEYKKDDDGKHLKYDNEVTEKIISIHDKYTEDKSRIHNEETVINTYVETKPDTSIIFIKDDYLTDTKTINIDIMGCEIKRIHEMRLRKELYTKTINEMGNMHTRRTHDHMT